VLELSNRIRSVVPMAIMLVLSGFLIPTRASGQEADPDISPAVEKADSIRAAIAADRPDGEYATDWVDVAGIPLKIIGFPIELVLIRLPAYALGAITAPRPPGLITRALRASSAAGVHPGLRTSVGPQSGVGAGLFVDTFDPIYLNTSITLRGSQRHQVGVLFKGNRAYARAEFRWQRDAQARFFGIGSRTTDDGVIYRREVVDIGASAGLQLSRPLAVDAGVAFEDNFVREPLSLGDETSIFDVFGPGELFGTEGRQRYVRINAGTELDLTHQSGFQRRGVTFRFEGAAYRGVRDTESDFHRLAFTAQGHLPLNNRQELAFRGHTEFTRAETGDVPFFHLASLGGKRTAIGFSSNRFTDLDLISLTAEWRYEIWRDIHNSMRVETFVHFGEGAVANRLDDIESPDWHESYGFGFRASSTENLLGVLFFGFSDESFHMNVSAEWAP